MAGGVSNPALAEAVVGAGGFGFLAGGYQQPDHLSAQIAEVGHIRDHIGVNLFAPTVDHVDLDEYRAYAGRLDERARSVGVQMDVADPVEDDDHWQDKIDVLCRTPVPVVSITFGLLERHDLTRLRRAGTAVLVTVTTTAEARQAAELGVDGLVAQGTAAGGHSGTHDPRRALVDHDTGELTTAVRHLTGLPVLAAGGVAGPEDVGRLLAAGASAVVVGTALLRTDESGASATHKDALADPQFTDTVVTRAFTGRPARALRTTFTDQHGATAPPGYPAVHHLTRAMRAAAAAAGDPHGVHLWAGTGFRHARPGPAADVVSHLSSKL